jgi:hypothetical protein
MPAMDYSRVASHYDLYANTDIDVAFFVQEGRGRQSVLKLAFYLHGKDDFDRLVRPQDFEIEALYGDYKRSEFDPQRSPFIIWSLSKG